MAETVTAVPDDVPIVFVHGLGGASSIDYAGFGPSFAGHRCVLVDLPGSGGSAIGTSCDLSIGGLARHVAEVLRNGNVSRAVLFGHSMGGAVVTSLAALWPELVAGVLLTESNLDPGGGTWSRRIARFSEADFASHGYGELIAEQQRECPTWAHTVALSSPLALHREAVSLIAGTAPTWRETLYGLQCPKFYVFGDKNLPDPDADELPRHGVEVLTVENAGHNMAYDNPSGLAEVVAHCLAQLPD